MNIIDYHTHIFPDKVAKAALDALSADSGSYQPRTDGTLNGLLDSMQKANISSSVVASIATKPSQMSAIFEFAKQIKSDRIHPFVSFNPSNDTYDVEEMLGEAHQLGIRGVKLHPMYQNFNIDDKFMYGYYELIAGMGLQVMFHTGFDMAFPGNTQGDVERVRKVADWFKDLTIICTHVGGWKQWERISCLSDCRNVYTETSLTLTEISDEEFVKALSFFDEDRVLFGSDSPWADQKEMLDRTMKLKLSDQAKEKMLYKNAARLLGLKMS
jgi:predicted TIM-barrel fold metal-dependent hydrolase